MHELYNSHFKSKIALLPTLFSLPMKTETQ